MSQINWITPVRGNQKGGQRKADYFFHLASQKAGAKARGMQGAIRVSELAMKRLRWIAGDRVMLGRDDTHVYLKRVQSGGYALSPVGGEKNNGKPVACAVKTSRIQFPTPVYVAEAEFATLDDGTVMIEATSEAA